MSKENILHGKGLIKQESKYPKYNASVNDHVSNIVKELKEQYSKHSLINGSKYEIYLGEGIESEMSPIQKKFYEKRIDAINIIKKSGLIKQFKIIEYIEEAYDENDNCIGTIFDEIWLAECIINEKKITLNKDTSNIINNRLKKQGYLQINIKKGTENDYLISVNGEDPIKVNRNILFNDLYLVASSPQPIKKNDLKSIDSVSNINKSDNGLQKEIRRVTGENKNILKSENNNVVCQEKITLTYL